MNLVFLVTLILIKGGHSSILVFKIMLSLELAIMLPLLYLPGRVLEGPGNHAL